MLNKEKEYQYNKLSFQQTNCEVRFIYSNGNSSYHKNIHYPDRYISTVFSNDNSIVEAEIIDDGKSTFVKNANLSKLNNLNDSDDLPF
tara:strand:+ start:1420 stop:1683 length:264 start_codon:yes stop_codon:yes gene_type:complete